MLDFRGNCEGTETPCLIVEAVARLLEGCGNRVQESVFECLLSPADLHDLLDRADRMLDPRTDSLRAYRLCGSCETKTESRGVVPSDPRPACCVV